MIKKNFKIGDTVSLFCNDKLVVKGIVYIFGSIPIDKFYSRQSGASYKQDSYSDTYEDALVLIDNKNSENLVVLTLENDDYKLFVWNDIFDMKRDFIYRKIPDLSYVKIVPNEVILTEISYEFK